MSGGGAIIQKAMGGIRGKTPPQAEQNLADETVTQQAQAAVFLENEELKRGIETAKKRDVAERRRPARITAKLAQLLQAMKEYAEAGTDDGDNEDENGDSV